MKIKRVEHIAIAVDSLKQSIDLMKDTFGIPLEYEEQIGQTKLAMLPVGQTYIELLEGPKVPAPGLFHICFEVEDIDGALAELKAKGALDGDVYVTGLPGDAAAVRTLSFPFSDQKKLAEALPFALESEIPVDLDEIVLSWAVLGPSRNDACA